MRSLLALAIPVCYAALCMAWSHKEAPTPFDTSPIHGLYFLDGDLLARALSIDWIKGEKLPMIAFPSGEIYELWESGSPDNGIVHLFGEMDLSYRDTRDNAYQHALALAEQVGGLVQKVGENRLDVWGDEAHLLVTYDNQAGHIVNVERVGTRLDSDAGPPRPPLLDEESRKKLPPLYSQEHVGLNALAQIKFFTPDSSWEWFASEASALLEDDTYAPLIEKAPHDPGVVDVLFFGLVSGLEVELGYFSLSELEDAHGPLGLPIERDRAFVPTSLQTLRDHYYHQRGDS